MLGHRHPGGLDYEVGNSAAAPLYTPCFVRSILEERCEIETWGQTPQKKNLILQRCAVDAHLTFTVINTFIVGSFFRIFEFSAAQKLT
jgi:hypothetical protein